MHIRAIIFDYGGVLCVHPDRAVFEALGAAAGIPAAAFVTAYWDHRIPYDRHTLDGPAYWAALATQAGVTLDTARIPGLIEQDSQLWGTLSPSMIALARSARAAGLATAILSNMPADLGAYLRDRSRLFACFDQITLSCELGATKPDPLIYQRCLHALGTPPHQTLFLDDREENVRAARALGMHARLVHAPGEVAAAVAAELGLAPINPHLPPIPAHELHE